MPTRGAGGELAFGLSNVLLRPSRHPSIPRGNRPDRPGTHRRVHTCLACDTGSLKST